MTTSSLHQIGVMTRLTFREAWRRKLLWIGLGLGGAFIGLFTLGFYFAWKDFTSSDSAFARPEAFDLFANTFMMAGLYVVNFLVVMVTVLTSVGTISSEVADNTIHAIAAKPVRRWVIVFGKWLGHGSMLAIFTVLLATGVMLAVSIISGNVPYQPLAGIGVMIMESLAILSVSLLGGTRLSTLANGVVAFMLYGVAFVGGWVEQIGTMLDSQTARDIGIASSLIMPSEALWRYASAVMQPPTIFGLQVSPFSVFSEPTPAFVVYALFYIASLLLFAAWSFTRRDF